MSTEQYNELMQELNFYDQSVGIFPLSLDDAEGIKDVLEQFNFETLGIYETRNTKGYKFKDSNEVYSIQEDGEQLKIYKLIEL